MARTMHVGDQMYHHLYSDGHRRIVQFLPVLHTSNQTGKLKHGIAAIFPILEIRAHARLARLIHICGVPLGSMPIFRPVPDLIHPGRAIHD